MIYQAIIESSDEIMSATWDGGQFIEIYRGENELPVTAIDIWNYAEAKPYLKLESKALAEYMMGWMKENEPTFLIETVAAHTIAVINMEPDEDGNLQEI